MRRHRTAWALLGLLAACGAPSVPSPRHPSDSRSICPARAVSEDRGRWLTIIGTNDVHGHLDRVAVLGGYVRILREMREREGGGVLLVDAGDMWQGTLVSNLAEGAPMVRAYSVVGYDAVTLGNHEFDYGPVGPASSPRAPGDDPRGALLARLAEASFPVLNANLLERASGEPVRWPGLRPRVLRTVAGVHVGLLGVVTEEALTSTLAANVSDLTLAPLAETISQQARALRAEGAEVVVVLAHAGGECTRFDDPRDRSTCAPHEEIVEALSRVPRGLVDVVVAGHTHAGMGHFVGDVAVVEAYAYGRAFSRVDLWVQGGKVRDVRIHPPHPLCRSREAPLDRCHPGRYEGKLVRLDTAILEATRAAREAAAAKQAERLGPELTARFSRHATSPNPAAGLLTRLMLEARPEADVALLNAGGIRKALPKGPLTYGNLYEAFPFDNRFAWLEAPARALRELLVANLHRERGHLFHAGVRLRRICRSGEAIFRLERDDGQVLGDEERLRILASDFLVQGGDGALAPLLRDGAPPRIEDGPPLREALADVLRRWGERSLEPRAFIAEDEPVNTCPPHRASR